MSVLHEYFMELLFGRLKLHVCMWTTPPVVIIQMVVVLLFSLFTVIWQLVQRFMG